MKTLCLSVVFIIASLTAVSAHAEDGWKNESQAGVVIATGNTETTTLNAGQTTTYGFDSNAVKFTAGYLYQKSGNVLSAKSWNLGLRYDRTISDVQTLFIAETIEGDRFKGLNQRYSTDIGSKYTINKDDTLNWFAEAGYRYTKENTISLSRTLHYARAYTEIEKKWNASVSSKYWLEYLPNFTRSTDWQANTELSLSAVLTSVFSVKTGYLLKFDNEVNAVGLQKSDKIFTTSLVAKF